MIKSTFDRLETAVTILMKGNLGGLRKAGSGLNHNACPSSSDNDVLKGVVVFAKEIIYGSRNDST